MSDTSSCPRCGGQATFDPASGALVCPYCGQAEALRHSPEAVVMARSEQDLMAVLEKAAEGTPWLDLAAVDCAGCGARTTLPEGEATGECPFCGRQLREAGKSQRALQPTALLPFTVSREEAIELWQMHVSQRRLTPRGLVRQARHEKRFTSLYLPCWLFSALAETQYEVDVLRYEKTRKGDQFKERRVSGAVFLQLLDEPLLASASLDEEELEALAPWELGQVQPFDPAYLLGHRAELYRSDVFDAWKLLRSRTAVQLEEELQADAGGDIVRRIEERTTYQSPRFRLILLPVWFCSFRYRGRRFRFLVNGHSGSVTGETPTSHLAVALLAAAGAAAVGLMTVLARGCGS